ncbi:MAG: putative phosphohistidine phosphatase, SixA [Fluviicola sp.]|jgi:phosphohistidine phosphatase|uniref:SixA phosphatase family protein n=1 Tax=Fluviicola sp. TaxID=1917219 RepID=UPI00261C8FA0|nr:histidine phosphatase family protein [Fluviicola sp.]MDF3027507.1 putative phosphohistidine phosphatase, SixA [Fluviicola sp.]
MLTLNLIRHAKTQQISPTGNDYDRELLAKGISQANVLGNYLQTHHISLGKVVCSSAVRTQQTKSIICQHLTERCNSELTKELYDASHYEMIRVITDHGKNEPIVTLVGHNEGISQLASYLSGEIIPLRTSEMVSLAIPFESWDYLSEGIAAVIFQYRPEVFLPHPVVS